MENCNAELYDFEPRASSVLREVLAGLSQNPKTLSPKFLYDKRGSEIFEEICKLEEYYPTRAEEEILKDYASEISSLISEDALIIEPGSGSGEKIRFLIPHLKKPTGYVPVEISKSILLRMTEELHQQFPELNVHPVCMDFTKDFDIPDALKSAKHKVVFFPGSTIGNFTPEESMSLLRGFGRVLTKGDGLLIGVDLKKDAEILEHAYDDREGVTAGFNLNLLNRLNREISAEFNICNFQHQARYNKELGRVEMHLVSKLSQIVRVHETIFRFQEGETIHTENSYKYSENEFITLAGRARYKFRQLWKNRKKQFCVYYFEKD